MSVPREILRQLRTHLEVEIQAGRRRAPLDPDVVREFLSPAPRARVPAEATAQAPSLRATVHAAPEKPQASAPQPEATSAALPLSSGNVAATAAPVRSRAQEASSLEEIAGQISGCTACHLAQTRNRVVPGEGNAHAPEVMFIGEAPGADEDEQGRPFVGRAGQLLTKMIEAMGFKREEVFIANVLKCRPPGNATPTAEEMAVCLPFLKKQIALVRPKTIVALGATAWKGLSGDPKASLSRVRGIWQDFGGIPLMPTFHPAYLLRYPSAKRTEWEDLQKVLAKLGREPPRR